VTDNLGFQITLLFKGKYLKTAFTEKVTTDANRKSWGRGGLSNGTSFYDLE